MTPLLDILIIVNQFLKYFYLFLREHFVILRIRPVFQVNFIFLSFDDYFTRYINLCQSVLYL